MKTTKTKTKETISGRLMGRVLIVSALIFTLTFTLFLHMAASKMREEATDHAHSELSNTIHQIDAVLRSVEIAVENTAWIVPHLLATPDSMYNITERLLRNNDFIYGSAVAFDPTLAPETDITLSADERGIGGLGIFLIRQIMNEVRYQRIDGKNALTLEKRL